MKQLMLSLIEQGRDAGLTYPEMVREFRRAYIKRVLEANKGNQVRAARELGMHRNSLSRNMEELGIQRTAQSKPVQRITVKTEPYSQAI
jgi:Fis family transcriptional regulator